jgi:hypothetical protein
MHTKLKLVVNNTTNFIFGILRVLRSPPDFVQK